MARIVLTDASVVINGINLSEFITSVALGTTEDVIDTTGMGSAGARTRQSGLADNSVTFEFNGRKMTLHRPHPAKEALRYRVLSVREFIESVGIKP